MTTSPFEAMASHSKCFADVLTSREQQLDASALRLSSEQQIERPRNLDSLLAVQCFQSAIYHHGDDVTLTIFLL